ncbi:MAG: hypothetical protein OXG49_09910 [Chloroflexi bacterium]|nr:hypothetical protein [Chloroflexota bacterium]
MDNAIEVMQSVIASYHNHPKWISAPLSGIKTLSNTHVGSAGQDFVRKWCELNGLTWEGSYSVQSPWDARIEGITFEVKTATEDKSGKFQFNHVRYHRSYQALLCLGVGPDAVLFNAWRKGDVTEGVAGKLASMDKGSSATFKLTKKPSELLPISEFRDHVLELVQAIG